MREIRRRRKVDPLERFMKSVNKTEACWLWTACSKSDGYGQFHMDGRHIGAHRAAYLLLVGPIPDGLTLDHRCHTDDPSCPGGDTCPHRRCVNPAHLEPVTMGENMKRGRAMDALRAWHAKRTHCPSGHPLSGDNIIMGPDNDRVCRACNRIKNRRRDGDRPPQRTRGPLRRVTARHQGRRLLECGHTAPQGRSNRARCATCEAAYTFSDTVVMA